MGNTDIWIKQTVPKNTDCQLLTCVYELLWECLESSPNQKRTLQIIEKESGLSLGWLRCLLRQKGIPSVNAVETLYVYLTGKTINLD
jgi:hypothetical protein